MTRRHTALGLLVGVALTATACGSDDDAADATTPVTEAPADTAPATDAPADTTPATDAPADTVPATDAPADSQPDDSEPVDDGDLPERVISLSPTHTEIMFAIGADDLLVAVDDFSNYPAEALDLPHELSGFEPSIEAIADYEPDLVLIGGDFNGLGPQLEELGIDFFDGPAAQSFDDTYSQIEQIGALTGHVGDAAELVSSMQTRLDEIVAAAPDTEVPLKVYHEVDDTYYSADSTSFIGATYALFGLENIADQADGDNYGYPQLNPEAIIAADPDLIFLPCGTYCFTTPEEVAARPGWDAISAVQNGNVIEVDEDLASRWGPRVVDYVAAIGDAVQRAAVPA